MRLDKYVSEAMGVTRSESRRLIKRGTVTVDGAPAREPDMKVTGSEKICAGGTPLNRTEFVYIMLNKPEGVVSASRGSGGELTVTDLVREEFPRRELFPAGRLDKTSTGFVLLTDDGQFAHDILAPGKHVPKTYLVKLDTPLTEKMAKLFSEGPTLADGTRLDAAEVHAVSADGKTVEVILHQGVYHQIKRMFGLCDAGVDALHRTAIGGVELDAKLKPGECRLLTENELEKLKNRSHAE